MAANNPLLFFDTFSHEVANTLQLDLVQFPRAVQVSEIRVIPLGARVQADFPGGVRLGATNPSLFEIEFFINDLSKRGAATFENVGKLMYSQQGNINIEFDKKPPTDGLLLRGKYNTITLAVYGSLTKVQRDGSPPKTEIRPDIVTIPQPPPEKVNTHERIRHWLEDTKRKQHGYEINPSEEESPAWEAKNRRSPVEFEPTKTWKVQPEGAAQDNEKDKKSYDQSQSVEKTWERAERMFKEPNRKEHHSERHSSSRGSPDLSQEIEKVQGRISTDHFEKDDTLPREKRRSEEPNNDWDEKRSEELTSLHRPRTPLDSTADPPVTHLTLYAKEEDRNFDNSRTNNVLPPPILSDNMEAISDDEDLPDLPPPDISDFRDGNMEDEDAEPPQPEEVTEENEIFEYEQIMSDEDDLPEYQYEEDFIIEEWEDWIKPFMAQDLHQLPKLAFYTNPSTTNYECDLQQWKSLGSNIDNYEDKQVLGCKLSSIVKEAALPTVLESNTPDGEEILDESGEVWVQAVEQVCQLLPSALIYADNSEEILKKLCEWIECGLDINIALNQQKPVFKIRHMKVGIRLTSLLMQIRPSLASISIVEKLFSVYQQPHLALPIKLQIIKTFDIITSSAFGLTSFVYDKSEEDVTGYESILALLTTNQQSRAKMALAAVVRKIHLLEVCEKLYSDSLILVTIFGENNSQEEKILPRLDEEALDVEMKEDNLPESSSFWTPCIPPELLNSIDSCLKEIVRIFSSANQLLLQPNRCMPGSKKFQLPKHDQNPLLCMFTIFEMTKLLPSISLLLVTPSLCQNPFLCQRVKKILQLIMLNEKGIRFLAWQPNATLMLIKSLLQYGDETREGQFECGSFYQLGAQLCAMMYCVQQLDSLVILQRNHSVNKKLDDNSFYESQSVTYLHSLESLLISPMGKEAIVSVLGVPPFFQVLLPYLQDDDKDPNPTKIACFGYVVDILSVVIKCQDNSSFVESYAEKINSCISCLVPTEGLKLDEITKLQELQPWVSVVKDPDVFSYEKLSCLSDVVQESLEKLAKFPGELFTALRILFHLTIPKVTAEELGSADNGIVEELKYKYATIQLFSANLHIHIINMLSKLFTMYNLPFLHSSNFSGPEGASVVKLLKPALPLLKNIVDLVIQTRNTDFKDLTAIIPLVQTYVLLQAFPPSSQYFGAAHDLQQTVISILLSYTQVVYTTEGEEVLSKSVWTRMMAEVYKYLMNAPHTMVYVINLITELLPLPLPIESHSSLSKEESAHAIRVRKLWSAHLYSLAPTFQEITHRLGLATHPLLTHSLRRMCVALSDLSAPMALIVAKATLDLVLQTHRLDQRALNKEDSPKLGGIQASQQTTRALNMLASLVSHAPTKAAVLHLLRGGSTTLSHTPSKSEEKYAALVQSWCSILCSPLKATAHMCAQESLLTIIAFLVDHENAMQIRNGEEQFSPTCVPPKEILLPFVEALVEVIRRPSSPPFIISHCLQVLSKLIDHKFGFYFVKSVLDMKRGSLFSALQVVCNNIRKASGLYLLRDLLVFAQSLLMTFSEERIHCVSAWELAFYFDWKFFDNSEAVASKLSSPQQRVSVAETSNGDDVKMESKDLEIEPNKNEDTTQNNEKNHPLRILENLIVSEVEDEEMMEILYDEVYRLISLFEKETSATLDVTEMEEPIPVGLDSIQELFANRIVWTCPNFDDDLHSSWFLPPSYEESELQDVQVSVNLMEICSKYTPEFDLEAALQKFVSSQTSHSSSPQKLSKVSPNYKPTVGGANRPDRRGKHFASPMRGRSYGRSINIRSDPFRSRPPNTSRPPSLHVDDFVALESTGHQPTGPTGYNKISFGRGKMMLDSMRGSSRGRTRGDSRGGRFFHRPQFRTEGGGRGSNRSSGARRGSGWVFRGEGSQRGTFNRFNRTRPFSRGSGSGGGGGGGQKDRFSQKFDRGGRHLRGGFR